MYVNGIALERYICNTSMNSLKTKLRQDLLTLSKNIVPTNDSMPIKTALANYVHTYLSIGESVSDDS